jgi:hypothetical protein
MANYNDIKNAALIAPTTTPDLGTTNNRYGNVYISGNVDIAGTSVTSNNVITPKVSSIAYPGDDTAADIAGGQTITLTGTGFAAGTSVLINGSIPAGTVSVISESSITFVAPAMSAGTYVLYLINPDGGTAISIPGISYSGVPSWTTTAGSLGSIISASSFSTTLTATGDAPLTISVTSGSLPSGITLNTSTGLLSGTAPNETASTTYTFTVTASDSQNQGTSRNFSLTVAPGIVATGGTITTVGGYKIHTFNESGTFSVSTAPVGASVQYLVVGGGGGGGRYGGGGGAGAVSTGNLSVTATTYTVTIGAGGDGSTDQNAGGVQATQIGQSSVFGSITAAGGGGGGNYNTNGGNGGSGGGAGRARDGYNTRTGGVASAGYAGGSTQSSNNDGQSSAGGGGAGGVGGSTAVGATTGGAGGIGIVNPITGSTAGQYNSGTSSYYLAGGGSGESNDGTSVLGGLGGGGRGGPIATGGSNGTANTGGGGGGGRPTEGAGNGGSGVVVIRYQG